MNEDRQTDRFHFQQLDCHQVAREIAARVHGAKIGDCELRDQAMRAAKSAFLNLAERLPAEQPGTRRRHFAIANGSLHELVAAIDLASVLEAITPSDAREIQALALRLKRMLRALALRKAP
ncbi:MAG: four helix bundle protein [Deltaproteobacteria bacterium]